MPPKFKKITKAEMDKKVKAKAKPKTKPKTTAKPKAKPKTKFKIVKKHKPKYVEDKYLPPHRQMKGSSGKIKDYDAKFGGYHDKGAIPPRYTPNPRAGKERKKDEYDDFDKMRFGGGFNSRKEFLAYRWNELRKKRQDADTDRLFSRGKSSAYWGSKEEKYNM